MNKNVLDLCFRCTDVNGYPKVKILLDNTELLDYQFSQEKTVLSISVPKSSKKSQLIVQRYGKQPENWTAEKDQIVEITWISVDSIKIPEYVIRKNCKFEADHLTHPGSSYFGPNGIWTLDFCTPFITWLLDEKIQHESLYNQDYQFPWSYKLGPNSVKTLSKQLHHVDQLIRAKLV